MILVSIKFFREIYMIFTIGFFVINTFYNFLDENKTLFSNVHHLYKNQYFNIYVHTSLVNLYIM